MSDTEDERIFEIETAKNGRAGCKKCKQKCQQGEIRIAKIVANPFSEGKMKNWYHVECLFEMFKKQRATTARIEHESEIIGFNLLNDTDQRIIKEKISESNKLFNVSPKKNQPIKKSKKSDDPANHSNVKQPDVSSSDNLFVTFQNLVAQVADHPSYLDKTGIVKKMFEKGSSGNGFTGHVETWCRLLLPASVKRIYNLQSKQLIKLFSKIFAEDHEDMLEHLEQGDISETISHFYEQSRKFSLIPQESTITIQEVDSFLEHLSKLTKEDEQIEHFQKILKQLTTADLKTIIRLIKHDLRMGAGAKHILEGIHPDAYDIYKASKDLDGIIERCFKNKKGQSADIKILTPVFPMLADACKSVEQAMMKCPNGMFSEIKYDGERVQVHKCGNEFKYFSRSLKPVMPHKVSHFKQYISAAFPHGKDLIIDTEILMMDTKTGKPLPFGTLGVHKKAQFEDATVCLFVFDCIYYNGESLINRPLKERKQILNENMTEVPNHIVFSEMQEIDEPKKLAAMIAKVLKLGLEGLVLKDVMSKYEPGKRHWLKVKKDYLFGGAMADSADLIVLGAWYGTGQKGGMMSVFLMGSYNPITKKFCTVTKVHTGHDDKTLERLQKELKMNKISSDPDKVPNWLNCTRTMVPDFVAKDPKAQPVWEITGAEFTQHDVHTAHGISIRFPRVTKIRNDKTWETATNTNELKNLFEKSKEDTDVSLLLKGFKDDIDDIKIATDSKKMPKEEQSPSSSSSSKKMKQSSNNNDSPNSKGSSPKKRKYDESETKKSTERSIKKQKNTIPDESHKGFNEIKLKNPLPTLFQEVHAVFMSPKNNEVERYFLAYGGTILDDDKFGDATHIFHTSRETETVSARWSKTAKHLHIRWIVDSVNELNLMNIEKYAITWLPNQVESDRYLTK